MKENIIKKNNHFIAGQTLIETLVAAFILTMGISAAVGLAIYAFGTATNVTKQIVATGLAREGVEAVKNMRDTNWLQQATLDSDCYNFSTGASDAKCYKNWLNQKYCIDPLNAVANSCTGGSFDNTFNLSFDTSNANFWVLNRQSGAKNFGLNFDPVLASGKGYYYASNTTQGNSIYHRKITLNSISSPPFNTNNGPKLQIISQVWWSDKRCPESSDWPGTGRCSLEIQTFLTNWKNY